MNRRKTVIIGAGHVGAHVAAALMMQEICEEIVLVDKIKEKAWANAQDIQDMASYVGRGTIVRAGGFEELKDADICVVSACGEIFREDRLEELDEALDIADAIAEEIEKHQFPGIVVSITNPCDLVALYLGEKIRRPVIGTGTALDSSRFRVRIGEALGIPASSIEAFCIGEHGNSQVQVWSQVRIGGRFLDELSEEQPEVYGAIDRGAVEQSTTDAGWEILKGKGSTEFGIGAAAAEVIRAILTDSHQVLPCSVPYRRTKDAPQIYISVPAIVGSDGHPVIVPLKLNAKEQEAFDASCRLMEQYKCERLDNRR
jgi:L-lactate dehydrogenase